MALSFKKVARLIVPAGPRNFNNCGGSVLNPLLFVALYLRCRMSDSSCYVMWWFVGFSNGVYLSGIMSGS